MPTFCDLSGTERLPGIDGMSLLAHLRTGDPLPKRSLYWHYPHYHNGPPCGVVRSGKWKLIEWYENSILKTGKPILELYDLENDVSESVNLADSLKSLTMDLSGELRNWRTDVNAQMPFPNPNYK
jgi:arylsulfatase A-like enzyme